MDATRILGNIGLRLQPIVTDTFKVQHLKSQVSLVVHGLRISSIAHLHKALFPDLGMEVLLSNSDDHEFNELEC